MSDWTIWGALIASAACGLTAIAYLAVRSLGAWREFKRARRHVLHALERLTEQIEALAEKASNAADTRRAMASAVRLRRSLARLAVLRQAVAEAQDAFGRLTAVMPRR